MRFIFLTGRPGCGKSSVQTAIYNKVRAAGPPHEPWITHSSGDVARKLAISDPDVRHSLMCGQVAPEDKFDRKMVADLRGMIECAPGQDNTTYIIDGYPRYKAQLLDLMMVMGSIQFTVINLNVNEDNCLVRLMGRDRADDTLEIICQRFDEYDKKTASMIAFLDDRHPRWYFRFSTGDMTPYMIATEILSVI